VSLENPTDAKVAATGNAGFSAANAAGERGGVVLGRSVRTPGRIARLTGRGVAARLFDSPADGKETQHARYS
jgi:hypothetical protein